MASLQDQLLKAGLANKASARKATVDKRKKQKIKNKSKQVIADEATLAAQQAVEEKKAKDRALNQQKQQELEKRSIAAQVKQLVAVNVQSKGKGDVVLNFTDNNVVKRMYVSEDVHKLVTQARLTVVRLDNDYVLVPTPVADKIAQRDVNTVVYRADTREDVNTEEDDWYADYQIPDDLTW
ncbi:DUF2058 domain-containing protein [Alteromonas pelagimontana]|uniref:DUF2058 domain-containing protein n=1 Tax=Alteromonas pelagimontana TaxID=1858656 RepID=A0A6M4M9V8_9ALTE|nr:DUF2058 domain-containing protein [Alteromonas pelagimontana]QJR79460.1 DUF2058 domain-containing protein [Alteromonas pelagimontana]